MHRMSISVALLIAAFVGAGPGCGTARADDLSARAVLTSIERARSFLLRQQNPDGSWSGQDSGRYETGITSLALLALLNAGLTPQDEAIAKGLNFLRSIKEPEPSSTYELSLMVMALATAKDGEQDKARILTLATRLENGQLRQGTNAGSWSYSVSRALIDTGGDRSNGQFAILGLREAVQAGIAVDREVWQRAKAHWVAAQNSDGGWGYTQLKDALPSTGSMTVAGVATLMITNSMLRDDAVLNRDGTPNCCGAVEEDEELERGLRWLESRFSVRHNPGNPVWLLYYLYGLERAGRLSGTRFFGNHDWYREGAQFLIDGQSKVYGSWQGVGHLEGNPVIGTSFALLFLSKGLSSVLINKLEFGPRDPKRPEDVLTENWNLHRDDARNLTDLISGLPKWPKLLTWQILDFHKVEDSGGVQDMLQAPVLFISGSDAPRMSAQQIELLREYIVQGGFIFAVANCQSADFDLGFRNLVSQMYPGGEAELRPLPPEHPIYRSEYPLDPEGVELHGVDFGCRTAIVYSPDDLSCMWDKWMPHDPPDRTAQEKGMITRATRIGVNVLAYATGREPPNKLELPDVEGDGREERIERGLLQIAKLRHGGTWDAAPQALRNLLTALNRTVGLSATTQQVELPASDPDIFKYPIVYMHGRTPFQLTRKELEQLRLYLGRGGVLFADACCGTRQFDESFRGLIAQVFPDQELKRIPPDHELFTTKIGYDLKTIRRRAPETDDPNVALNVVEQVGEPFLEGIEIDGRYAVIYSKYDISCALERQASVACTGYVAEDAVKLAINIVLYAMLQDVTFAETAESSAAP